MSCVPVRSTRTRISIAPLGPYPIKVKDKAELVTTEVLDSPDEFWYSGHELVCCVVAVFFVYVVCYQTDKQTNNHNITEDKLHCHNHVFQKKPQRRLPKGLLPA